MNLNWNKSVQWSVARSFRYLAFNPRNARLPKSTEKPLQNNLCSDKNQSRLTKATMRHSWKRKGLNYRIQGHLFTSHWITKVPIVLCFVLEKILTHVKQVVWSGPAFCSCSEESSTALGFSNAEDVEEWAPWSTEINGKTSAKQLMFGQKPVQTNEGDHEAPMKEESSTALGFSNAEDVEEWAPWSSLRARVPSRH